MTGLALPHPLPTWRNDKETRRFLDWALIWIVLANIGFVALWAIGAPPRHFDIVLIAAVGLVAKRLPYPIQLLLFVAVMAVSTLKFLGGLFNLTMTSLIYSLRFFMEINPADSKEYIAVAIAILAVLVAAAFLLRRDTDFSHPSLLLAAAASVVALAGADVYMGLGMRGHYMRAAPAGAVFESATQKTGFADRADGKRHLVLIVVESLGQPRGNKAMADKLFALYRNPAVTARYEASQGTTLYYNSTTSGEIRELCGRWGDYYELLDRNDKGCLPARMRAKGYEAHALHSFTGKFFERATWYPHVGFQDATFDRDLIAEGALKCGGVFPGACDRFVPHMIAERLRTAKTPQFLYWLTLNSHLPVPPGLNLNVDHCEKVSPELAASFPMICRQFSIFDDIDRALVAEITADDFPDADILLVGDHMPPYFDRHHRTQFDPEHVPYLYLKRRDAAPDAGGQPDNQVRAESTDGKAG